MKQTEILTQATHVNGWFPAVYMSCISQNFRLFHVPNLSVRNFRIFLLMYTGSLFQYLRRFHRLLKDASYAAQRASWAAATRCRVCPPPPPPTRCSEIPLRVSQPASQPVSQPATASAGLSSGCRGWNWSDESGWCWRPVVSGAPAVWCAVGA